MRKLDDNKEFLLIFNLAKSVCYRYLYTWNFKIVLYIIIK